MKASILSLALICSALASHGEGPFSTDEALKQLYHEYDPGTKTAQWVYTKEQQAKGRDDLCQYLDEGNLKENHTVSVSVLFTVQVPEGDATRIYFATSATPARYPGEYDCHACAPAIGAAVYVWKDQRWVLESANTAVEFSEGWGNPPEIDIVVVGHQKHGLLLSSSDEGQGFASSGKELLFPLGKTIEKVWSIEDESDDFVAADPTDKDSPPPYRSSAAFRFLSGDDGAANRDGAGDYYDIEVISRGISMQDYAHPLKPENWIEIYSFNDGKYNLLRRKTFTEVSNTRKATKR
jgi:hypothetical protein